MEVAVDPGDRQHRLCREFTACCAQLLFYLRFSLSFFLSFFIVLYKLWDKSPSTVIHRETPFQLHASFQMFKIFVTF